MTTLEFNPCWHLGRQYTLYLTEAPACLARIVPTDVLPYDQLLVWRRAAREAKDWAIADELRDFAELAYGMTMVDCLEAEVNGGHDFQYFQPVRVLPWYRKWRPFLATTDTHIDLNRLSTHGYGRYAPGWVKIA